MIPPIASFPVALWRDTSRRNGPSHMALDEALLMESAEDPLRAKLRFYQWAIPEITIGFFVPLKSVAEHQEPVTRRWTGGGVVEHGDDLTFSLSIPSGFLSPELRAAELYRCIHDALAAALRDTGMEEAMAQPAAPSAAPLHPGFCFSAPVPWDVMDQSTGAKLAGGAQRRSRAGLLHQGSVRLPAPWSAGNHPWIDLFAANLAGDAGSAAFSPAPETLATAERLRAERYAHPDWLARR